MNTIFKCEQCGADVDGIEYKDGYLVIEQHYECPHLWISQALGLWEYNAGRFGLYRRMTDRKYLQIEVRN